VRQRIGRGGHFNQGRIVAHAEDTAMAYAFRYLNEASNITGEATIILWDRKGVHSTVVTTSNFP